MAARFCRHKEGRVQNQTGSHETDNRMFLAWHYFTSTREQTKCLLADTNTTYHRQQETSTPNQHIAPDPETTRERGLDFE